MSTTPPPTQRGPRAAPPLPDHPDPPADLGRRRLPLVTQKGPWFRIHRRAHGALYFGKSGENRFDAPAGEFAVLYVGSDEACAFIETFGHATGTNLVTSSDLATRCLSRVQAARPLRLVDLSGPGLGRLGADNRLAASDYGPSQRWSAALLLHPSAPDGILFRSRHDPSRCCIALHERTAPALEVTLEGTLDAPVLAPRVGAILDDYEFALV